MCQGRGLKAFSVLNIERRSHVLFGDLKVAAFKEDIIATFFVSKLILLF